MTGGGEAPWSKKKNHDENEGRKKNDESHFLNRKHSDDDGSISTFHSQFPDDFNVYVAAQFSAV